MSVTSKRNQGILHRGIRGSAVRRSAIRGGLLAVSAAAAALCSQMTARADINGINSTTWAAPNGAAGLSNSGYSASTGSGTFETTNGAGGEAVSGFANTQQTITSFDVTFDLYASGSADGGAFILTNGSSGTSYLGGGGGSGGYQGGANANNSVALEWEFYSGSEDGLAYNGGGPAYTYYTNVNDQGNNRPVLNSGDQMQFTLAYFGTTLTETVVDLANYRGVTKVYSNVNIPSVIGQGTAYVGFSGADGGGASTQKISNFIMVSNKTFAPIQIAQSQFTYKGIIPDGGSESSVNATQDSGTKLGGDTWYEQGFDTAAPSTGLPHSGTTFVSQADSAHVFRMQNYSTGNDVILLASASTASGPTSATINFPVTSSNSSTPTLSFNALSFLTASGNGPNDVGLTINYAPNASGGTHAATTGLSFLSPDWFSGSPSAWTANGRYSGNYDNVNSGNPNLYAADVVMPDNSDPISSVTLTFLGGNDNTTGNVFIFAISGEPGAAGPIITYTGASNNKWDLVDQNFNGSNGSSTPFVQGDTVNFDDTAAGSHIVDVTGTAMNISGWNVNTALGYTFYGNGLTGAGGLTLSGTGTVILANSNTYTGTTLIKSGLLQLNSSSSIASTTISISTGAALNISSGARLTGTAYTLNNSGTIEDFNATETVGMLAGTSTGSYLLNGTALSIASVNYAGAIGGTSGSVIFTGGGTMSGPITDGTTSPISVTYNDGGTGTTLFMSGSSTYTGGTYLTAGAMEIGLGTSLGTGTVYLQGGALGAVAGSGNVKVSNNIAGGQLTVPAGSGVLELSGTSNTFTGPVVINSGATLQLDLAGAIAGVNGANSAAGKITVTSGAELLVNDNTGTMGLTGGVVGGAPITAVISGTGVNGYGAIAGPAGGSATWAGNINTSGSASVSPGSGGTLTLTGAITGNGSMLYASASNDSGSSMIVLTPPASTSNNYTGESQVAGDATTTGALTVALGNNNGFSTAAGLNMVGGVGPVVVDFAGFNQNVQYLAGAGNSNSYITNNNTNTTSVLTVTSANRYSRPVYSGASIQGNIQLVLNDPSGLSNQVLTGSSTYTGGTTITKGTLTAGSATALGTGPVTLNGGTLALTTPGIPIANSTLIVAPASFNSSNVSVFQGIPNTLVPAFSGNTLTITEGGVANTANSAFLNTPVAVSDSLGFTASFNWNITPDGGVADGIAFVLQNDPRTAPAISNSSNPAPVSTTGGSSLGYAGGSKITNSAAVFFETYTGGTPGTGFGSGGNLGTLVSTSPVALDQDITVTLIYNGPAQTLTETLVGADATTFTTVFPDVDYSSLVGGPAGGSTTAYLGFTGGTGSVTSTQTISNVSYALNLPSAQTPTSPTSIGNLITAATNTRSGIQIGVFNGSSTLASVGGININSGATIFVSVPAGSALRGVLATPSVSIAATGKLDLAGNDLDVLATGGMTIGQVTALVKTGYNNGAWNGPGIASSTAASDSTHLTALAVIINDTGANTNTSTGTPLMTSLDGAAVNDGDILVKYTYYGDANLDGAVDGSDYSLIDNGFLNHLSGWYNGDFNYDGVIDGSDYTLMDNAFNQQGASLGSNPLAQLATATALISGTSSAVPEPASLSLLAIGATALLGRRRRQR